MSQVINIKLNISKVPRENYFKGQKGVYLDFVVSERREPTQYGHTHTVYLKHKITGETVYIGDGTLKVFEQKTVTDADLPPTMDDIEDAHVVDDNNADLPF